MAFRTWAKLLGVTLGVAALAGACQLGLAYGLGVLRLTRVLDVAVRDQWTAQLAWVAWFAMTAAVLGSLAGRSLLDRCRAQAGAGTFAVLAVAAGIGAALVVPLTMQPARTAQVTGVHPVLVIGFCAGLGAAVGVFAAYAALTQVIARWSLAATGLAIGVLALVSVWPSLTGDGLPAVRLGVFDAGFLSAEVAQRAALFTMPGLALIFGASLGYRARRRDLPTLTIALAGLPGPALLTLSYLIAGPGSGADRYQMVPYWAAMTATGAGVLGSVLAAVIRRGGDLQDAEPDTTPAAVVPEKKPVEKAEPKPGKNAEPAAEPQKAAAPKPVKKAKPPQQPRPVDKDATPVRREGRPPTLPDRQAVSAPLPQPEPISPPLKVTPAPDQSRKQKKDAEYVDWVSGLGNERGDD